MVLPRPSSLRGAQSFGRIASRRAGIQARSTLKNLGRRTYASGHEAKQSSDVPWMIGAVVFTVPAATWLLGQGPSKSDHGHGHGEHEEKHEEGGEKGGEEESKEEESADAKDEPQAESEDEGKDDKESKDDSADDAKDEAKDESKDEKEDSKDSKDGKDDAKEHATDDDSGDSETPNDEDYDGPSSGKKAQYFRNPNKKPGEGQKGDRPPTEKKGEKDSKSNYTGAEHPYISDPSKSRKSAGVTETARIHGTAKPTYANPTEPSSPETPKETSERA